MRKFAELREIVKKKVYKPYTKAYKVYKFDIIPGMIIIWYNKGCTKFYFTWL